jgi:hypothetical protein
MKGRRLHENGRTTFAAFGGPGAGVAINDHRQGNAIVQTLDYASRRHGLTFVRSKGQEDGGED